MKLLNLILVSVMAVGVMACGSSNPTSTLSNATGYNPYLNPYQSGYFNPGINGINQGMMGPQMPIYQNGQIVGYRTSMPLFSGFYQNVPGNYFQQSAQVNAGDRISVNLMGAMYGVSMAYCDGSVADSVRTGNRTFPLSNLSVSLNGQPLGSSGSFVVPTAGNLTIQAYLNPISVSCGWLFGNRPAQVQAYFVNLGGNALSYGVQSGVRVERCTSLQGAPMACPF